ncbi:MAG: PepSY domain-containing protein [Rhodanobacter sp.]
MSTAHRFLKAARSIHLYLGVFTAPMLLFFAITGGLQTFSLHETTRGSSYVPPAWLASMAQLHKKQTTVMPVRRPRPAETAVPVTGSGTVQATTPPAAATATDVRPAASSGQPAKSIGEPPRKNLLPMKIFFALVSLGLLISTLTGLYMSYRYSRKPRLVTMILAAGILVPLLLLLF